MIFSRLVPVFEGFSNYGNPLEIAVKRIFTRHGLMNISDRKTGITVRASRQSYQMFGETWYNRDYDVPGCPLRAGDSVIDVGANQGFFTCYAASKGARVYAFEPFPESFARLRENTQRNGFSSTVDAEQMAVSGSTGEATLYCSEFLGGGGNTLVPAHAKSLHASSTVGVRTVTLDSIVERVGTRVRLCKMDCEGSELEIIRTLSCGHRIDSFAIEFHPTAYRVCELVAAFLKWGTHQIFFARNSYVLYAVNNEATIARCSEIDRLQSEHKGIGISDSNRG